MFQVRMLRKMESKNLCCVDQAEIDDYDSFIRTYNQKPFICAGTSSYLQYSSKASQTKKDSRIKLRKPRETAWTIKEQAAYVQYLQKQAHLMKTRASRKANKVFKRISEIIGTRTGIQVKSHHQKLEQKYETVSNIIYHVNLYIKHVLREEQKEKQKQNQRSLMLFANEEGQQHDLPAQEDSIYGFLAKNNLETHQSYFFTEQSEHYGHIQGTIMFDNNDYWLDL